ncbi:MAG: acetate--CoA ligase family protein [Candidatus Kariarchaeaceae archaeon]|jgi:acetyltransferase
MVAELESIIQERRQPLEMEAYEFLTKHGVKLPQYSFAATLDDIINFLKTCDNNLLYAMKVMSPRIMHKSDFNAVHLNVPANKIVDKFTKLYDEFKELDFRGVLLVPMAGPGIELIVGSTTDATFGTISVFGVGGTLVEVVKDVTFGKSPLSFEDARLMIHSIRSQKLLKGPRGLPKLDEVEMANLLVKISEISIEFKEYIREIDLNPVRITAKGLIPLDARIIFQPEKC